ncbi:hypothetical protein [Rhodohalobacter sp. SW132]|uniref:hypothetical protein n=1 Tax=Rhodohalobacter sp. SW132 TaxID=2293433 RepID=UPI00131448D0|nr:hypothetical protein [Rhodohalobacter sp. SW132]
MKHIFLIIVLICCYFLWEQRPVRYGGGIIVESKPMVTHIAFPNSIETDNYIITPRYQIEGKVRVIANKRYWFDDMRHVSSVDLLLAWDRMSDEDLLRRMLVKIDDRSYHVQMTKPPFQRGNIHDNLIMAHTIPATERIQDKLKSIRRGQLIHFTGYIVDIENRIGNEWISPVRDHWPQQRSSQWVWFEDLEIIEDPVK